MKFFNREKEIREILSIIKTEPKLIHFIYGPINSGKTALIKEVLKKLDLRTYIPFYIDFRMRNIVDIDDFTECLLKVNEKVEAKTIEEYIEKISDFLIKNLEVVKLASSYLTGIPTNIPVPKELLENLMRKRENKVKVEDVYLYIEELFLNLRTKGKIPVLILDEFQMLKDISLNRKKTLLKSFFQFLVGFTKAHHLSHVFCISSDSLFIEYIYSTGELEGRAKYILVDDFDKENALKFMDFYAKEVLKRKLLNEEKEKIYNLIGGKPIYIMSIIDDLLYKNLNEALNYFLQNEKQKIFMFLSLLDEEKIVIGNKTYILKKEEIIKTLKDIAEKEVLSQKEYYFLVQKNILFLDPIKGILKPQSRLTYHAIKEALKELNLN